MIRGPAVTSVTENTCVWLLMLLATGHVVQASIRITSMHVPSFAVIGDSVVLRCVFDLGNETLYSLMWYRKMKVFSKYSPRYYPHHTTFPQAGIDVDITRSDESSVYLRNVDLDSSGFYTCQISTGSPYFNRVSTSKYMEVVVPPSHDPVLLEDKDTYKIGDNVSILCKSGKAKPAPDLEWYINDQLVQSELSDQDIMVYPDQLKISSLALRFRLLPEILHNGTVVLKCVAIFRHMHVVETVKEITVPQSDDPVLLEDKATYELGENVSILCKSRKVKPAPELKWYINDQLVQSRFTDKETVVYPDQLEISSLSLRFRLMPVFVDNGKVVLKCVATFKHMHTETIKEITVENCELPPSDSPVLLEDYDTYELGKNVSILCISGKAKPAPELKWYINDQLVQSELSDKETVVYPNQLEISSLALRFRLQPEFLHNGKLVLKCVASFKDMYSETIKEIMIKDCERELKYLSLLK